MQTPGRNIFTNTFTGAMKMDRTPYAQDPRTYASAYNGNIIFTGSGDGHFTNEKGNAELAALLPDGYIPIGFKELVDKTVIWSSNEIDGLSEIGYLKISPLGVTEEYVTVFNDEFDPNGDKLNFNPDSLILSVEPSLESVNIERVYWNTGNAEPRRLNLKTGLQSVSSEFVDGNYQPLTSTGKYPHFYSVHSMSLQPDLEMGRLELEATNFTDGTVKTGMYELAYRLLTRDGYATPWSPLTRHFFVTLDPVLETYHDRAMYASNVMTNRRYRFYVIGVDLRFYQMEVAYVYSIDKDTTVEASIFYREKIAPDGGGTVSIDFSSTTGVAVSLDEFNRYIVPIRRAATLGQKDNRLWPGGIETYGAFDLDLSAVTVEPITKQMLADNETSPTVTPITEVGHHDYTVTKQAYLDNTGTPVNNSYAITDDYASYKGVQYEHLFSSYWGGETYPFALVVFDLKGNPSYAFHIKDYTFPNRYDRVDNEQIYQLMQGSDFFNLNLLGVKFSGIDLTGILFDKDGKRQVSGVAIVRVKDRKPKTLTQGILLPAVIEKNSTDEDNSTEPLPITSNHFEDPYTIVPDSKLYKSYTSNGKDIASRPYTGMLYTPDLLFERNLFEGTNQDDVVFDADRVRVVALYDSPYDNTAHLVGATELEGDYKKYYTKNYQLVADVTCNLQGGDVSRVQRLQTVIYFDEYDSTGYDKDDTDLKFRNDANIDDPDGVCGNPHSQGVRNVWIVKTKDFKNMTYFKAGESGTDRPRYYVVNYEINQDKYYTDANQSSLEQRLYIGTGHFQPITDAVLESIKTTVSEEDKYILNGVEVWGGDCYPWVFDFVRLYPKPGDCGHDGDCWGDYGVAHVVPLECSMNIALRRGRSFAGDGIRSQAEACGVQDPEFFPTGIMEGQPEEFYLNSVVLHQSNVQAYVSKPSLVDPSIIDFDYLWLYSNLKIKNEILDQYCTFLTSNRGEMNALHGAIIGRGYFGDEMYCLQEKAFSKLRINELKAISTQDGRPISTGVTEIWQKPDKLSDHGCLHPFAIVQTPKALYWPDYFAKCFCRFAQDGVQNLSEAGEFKQWSLDTLKYFHTEDTFVDDEIRHIAGGYDPVRDMIYWSLLGYSHSLRVASVTIAYCEDRHVNGLVAFMPFISNLYGSAKGYMLSSPIDSGSVYAHLTGDHGTYYGVAAQTKIKFYCNPNTDVEKIWENAWANLNPDGHSLLRTINWKTELQTGSVTVVGDTRSGYRNLIFETEIVDRATLTAHISGKYLEVEFVFDNEDDKQIMFTSHDTAFSPVNKIR